MGTKLPISVVFRTLGLSSGESGGFLRGKSFFHPGKAWLCWERVKILPVENSKL